MRPIQELTRKNIRELKPYSSARDEYQGIEATVFLDANESPYNNPHNRYPDPLQKELKEKLSIIKGVSAENIFLGNGSDEAIDLLFRAFCEPGVDNVVAIDPTYGMYQVCADINNITYRKVLLDENYQFTADQLLSASDNHTKLIFLCSPNNPTGNNLCRQEIIKLITAFEGLIIVDEAYSDFSDQPSLLNDLDQYPNLVVLQTFSKAWSSAGIRLGMAFASQEIIQILNKIKYPYNVNVLTQKEALNTVNNYNEIQKWIGMLNQERIRLSECFKELSCTEYIYPSDANFFLAKVTDAKSIYDYLVSKGIIVRNRSSVSLCRDCLRITVGTPEENNLLLTALRNYELKNDITNN